MRSAEEMALFVQGFRGGAESAAQTIERVAAEWRGLPEGKAAVERFASLVAKAVREAAATVTEERNA